MDIRTFRGGIHPKGFKNATPVERALAPKRVAILLSQSVGAPAEPLVAIGERVLMYQKIGEPGGPVGAPVHASVSGVVLGIEPRDNAAGMPTPAVVIESDGRDEPAPGIQPRDPDALNARELLDAIREAGIVGLGGAAFPTQVKLDPPDAQIDTLILNGAECEPHLTCDHRTMLDSPEAVVDGLLIARKILGAARACIAIEDNKPDAIEAIRRAASGHRIDVCRLSTKYPQGSEKQLIHVLTGREVPSGGLPMDVGCIVINVSTAAAISDAIRTGRPLVERTVTIAGAVMEPKNLRVRVGESIGSLIAQCGGAKPGVDKVVLGGPMMGQAATSLDVPVVKATCGVLLIAIERRQREGHCIRCARCAVSCPIRLMPMQLHDFSTHGRFADAQRIHAMDCIECGCCSYVCPAKLPLVESIRAAKQKK